MNKVIFDGVNKHIIINSGETEIDVQIDLYSDWKEWVRELDNAKWAAAFRTFGGDETGENQYAPRYYFLINNWKIVATDITCVVQTNLYSDDGLSPFIISNAAITNRASDVPIIQSDIEQRLAYGDRIYYDESSSYTGIIYPVGTIAQPVNNIMDTLALSVLYNITDFYCLSDITLSNISGVTFDGYSIYADREGLSMNITGKSIIFEHIDWHDFIIDAEFGGGVNIFNDCIINGALDVSGIMKDCQIQGLIRIHDYLVMQSCYSGVAGSQTPSYDMNENRTTKFSLRTYSGGVTLLNCNNSGDTTTLELVAGQVILTSGCTDGYIDIRGVGYLTDNSSGSTVKTTGFIDSLEEYLEETKDTDERLAYGDNIYYDESSIYTGSTYPVGTIAQPVNNAIDAIEISIPKNISKFNMLSDVALPGITGQTFSGFNLIGIKENIKATLYGNKMINTRWENVNIYADFSGGTNSLYECNIYTINEFIGEIYNSKLIGNMNLGGDTNIINCYSGDDVDTHEKEIPIFSLNGINGSNIILDFRSYSGDVIFDKMQHVDDTVTIDLNAGRVILNSGCTNGIIDIRGIGYVIDNSSSGCTVQRDGQLQSSPFNYNNRIVIDVINGKNGILYPIGTNSEPVNNITDAITLLSNYNLSKIHVIGTLTINNNENLNNISFTAERSTGNYLFVENGAITNGTYIENLTTNIVQSGTCRYTTSVILGVTNYDGGIKNCLLVGAINVVGDGSNYFTDCDTYTTDTSSLVNIIINDKKVNMIRCRGFYKISNKTGPHTTTIDMVGGIIEIDSGCTSGDIYIGGICEVIDNSGSGCTITNEAISRQSIEDSTWDAAIIDHLEIGSTGDALYNVSAGASPEIIAQAVWDKNITGYTNSNLAGYKLNSTEAEIIEQRVYNYDNILIYDAISGFTGSTYPTGTNLYPVNNLDDLLVLSNDLNIKNILVKGSIIINSAITMVDFKFITTEIDTPIQIDGIVNNCEFNGFVIDNSNFNGAINRINDCTINNISNFKGYINDSLLTGIIEAKEKVFIINSFSDWNNSITPKIELSNMGDTINIRNYSGELIFDDVDDVDDTIIIDMLSGRIILNSGCTSGDVEVRGIGSLEDNSTGTNVINNLLSPEDQDAIILAIDNVDTRVKRILGLTQENFRIIDQVYDGDDRLTSATIKIYNNSSDCDNDVNPLQTYSMTAIYDSNGRLTNYKVVK